MWFIVESQFRSSHGEDPSRQEGLLERLLFLVNADSLDDAARKSATIAKGKEHSNAAGRRVHWTFLKVTDIREILDQRLEDGAEIISWLSGFFGGVDENDGVMPSLH